MLLKNRPEGSISLLDVKVNITSTVKHLSLNANRGTHQLGIRENEIPLSKTGFEDLILRTQGLDVLSHLAPSCLSSGPHFIQVPRGLAGTCLPLL